MMAGLEFAFMAKMKELDIDLKRIHGADRAKLFRLVRAPERPSRRRAV